MHGRSWSSSPAFAASLWDSEEAIQNYIKGSSGLMRVATAGLFIGTPKSIVAEVLEVD
jgi:hypothetical protein